MCVHTHTQLPCGWFSHCVSCFAVFCTPVGKAGKGERSVVNDGAYDAFLKQVESMHAQGRASFEAEFNVSLSVVGLLFFLKVLNSYYACKHMCTHADKPSHTCLLVCTQSVDKKTAASTASAELNNNKNRYKNIFPCEWFWAAGYA